MENNRFLAMPPITRLANLYENCRNYGTSVFSRLLTDQVSILSMFRVSLQKHFRVIPQYVSYDRAYISSLHEHLEPCLSKRNFEFVKIIQSYQTTSHNQFYSTKHFTVSTASRKLQEGASIFIAERFLSRNVFVFLLVYTSTYPTDTHCFFKNEKLQYFFLIPFRLADQPVMSLNG